MSSQLSPIISYISYSGSTGYVGNGAPTEARGVSGKGSEELWR